MGRCRRRIVAGPATTGKKEFRCVRFDRQRHEGAGNEDDARFGRRSTKQQGASLGVVMRGETREKEIPVSRTVCARLLVSAKQ